MRVFRSVVLLMLCSLLAACSSTPPPSGISGGYQDCLDACLSIQLKPDHTFVYRLDNDMRSNERFYGTWSELPDQKIHAVIPEPPPGVVEKHVDGEGGYRITVVGERDGVLSGATVTPVGTGPATAQKTGQDGVVTIPRSEEFEVEFPPHRLRYRPKAADANTFKVQVQLSTVTLDQIWRIEGERLFVSDDRWLAKLIPADEEKLFH